MTSFNSLLYRNSIRWHIFSVHAHILFPTYCMIQTAFNLGHLYHPRQLWLSSHTLVLTGARLSPTCLSACRACQLTRDCGLAAAYCAHLDTFITVKKKRLQCNKRHKLKGALNGRDLTSLPTPHLFQLNTKSDNARHWINACRCHCRPYWCHQYTCNY